MDMGIQILWKDRKRILGMPISFTRYSLSKDRLFLKKGLFSLRFEEIVLYRVRDIGLKMSLWQRMFGVGTVIVHSSDKTTPHFALQNVRHPLEVKEQIHRQVEEMKLSRRIRVNELMGEEDAECCDDEAWEDE